MQSQGKNWFHPPTQVRPGLPAVTPAWTNPPDDAVHFGMQPRSLLGRNAFMRNTPFWRWVYYASADLSRRRMTHRSLGAYAPKRYSAQVRRWVGFEGPRACPCFFEARWLVSV
jgi:hypothetical protein